ncbi:bacteriohemerythrin [Spirochaeta isovalerica]|uniref:Hemerythrin n=1 Tax=Spirochaeta isovalerica TaxID=150 RepID=A0A841RGQ2_9SPIO|nr:bacteriohemerythrin [Spirochaeta isovalerica]MBB6481502.1 hemerythrin [Spirochaeta isovalerica]
MINNHIPKWDDSFSVGNDRIDHQHQYFLSLIEYLDESVDSNTSPAFVKHMLDEILLYARFHFCSEENMMEQYEYAGYNRHKKLHEQLLHEVTRKIIHFSMNKAELADIIEFLLSWFLTHTINEDKMFHESLK